MSTQVVEDNRKIDKHYLEMKLHTSISPVDTKSVDLAWQSLQQAYGLTGRLPYSDPISHSASLLRDLDRLGVSNPELNFSLLGQNILQGGPVEQKEIAGRYMQGLAHVTGLRSGSPRGVYWNIKAAHSLQNYPFRKNSRLARDVNLAYLGRDFETFEEAERRIVEELLLCFPGLKERHIRAQRRGFLLELQRSPRPVFATQEFEQAYNVPAQNNISKALEKIYPSHP